MAISCRNNLLRRSAIVVTTGPESRAKRSKTEHNSIQGAKIPNKIKAFVELTDWLINGEVRALWGTMVSVRVTIQ